MCIAISFCFVVDSNKGQSNRVGSNMIIGYFAQFLMC